MSRTTLVLNNLFGTQFKVRVVVTNDLIMFVVLNRLKGKREREREGERERESIYLI
jgi:hypothetical protein